MNSSNLSTAESFMNDKIKKRESFSESFLNFRPLL